MKFPAMTLVISLILPTALASAAEILGGEYSQKTRKLELDVQFKGGCKPHYFSLNLDPGCYGSNPRQSSATLVHQTEDTCEEIQEQTLELDLSAFSCRPSFLTIRGDQGSSATVFVK